MASLERPPARGCLLLVSSASTLRGPDDTEGYRDFILAYARMRDRARVWLFVVTSRNESCFYGLGDQVTAYLGPTASPSELLVLIRRAGAGPEPPTIEVLDATPLRLRGAASPSFGEPGRVRLQLPGALVRRRAARVQLGGPRVAAKRSGPGSPGQWVRTMRVRHESRWWGAGSKRRTSRKGTAGFTDGITWSPDRCFRSDRA